jgi:hypothetical protein
MKGFYPSRHRQRLLLSSPYKLWVQRGCCLTEFQQTGRHANSMSPSAQCVGRISKTVTPEY